MGPIGGKKMGKVTVINFAHVHRFGMPMAGDENVPRKPCVKPQTPDDQQLLFPLENRSTSVLAGAGKRRGKWG